MEDVPKYGRFSKGTTIGKRYLDRFWHPNYFEAVKILNEACVQTGISMTDVAFRWLAFHSKLDIDIGDAVIVGASSVNQLNSNLEALGNAKPLPQIVLKAADKAWSVCKVECPRYFRT